MHFFTAFLQAIILLGALQGFILCSLLFFSKKRRKSNRILSVLIFLISLASLKLYAYYHNWLNSGLWELIPMIIVMPIGPLIFFYIKSFLDPSFKIGKRERRHFYPTIIDLVPSITILIYIVGYLTNLIRSAPAPWGHFIDSYNTYSDIPRWMSICCYLFLSYKYLQGYKETHNNNLNGHAVNYQWLRQIVSVFLLFQAIWF